MSEYVEAEIHETDESVELRWRYNEKTYGLMMGQEILDVLQRESGQKTAILMEALVFDVDTDHGTFWDAS
jgi:hypothetical protein